MNEITWAAAVGILLLLSQLLSIYNSSKVAQKNAQEPVNKLRDTMSTLGERVQIVEFRISNMERDINRAHDKIRANEASFNETSKAQNKALLAILLWIKDPEHGDAKQIDDAIKGISV